LQAGAAADLVSLRPDCAALAGRDGDALLDSWIFSGSSGVVDCVWAGGEKLVTDGRHRSREPVLARFQAAQRRFTT
jgi:cytosine/adenosine deaminase-related metal-dependent hydrolase